MKSGPQRAFISTREFVESWDKELYELTNLDYFIFLMINQLGNQLEKNYFSNKRRHLKNYLDFDDICTLSFNVGDAFGYFLEDNCFDSCPMNCPRDMDGKVDFCSMNLEDRIRRKLELLQSIMMGQLDKEECLRLDLMNHVIITTMQQFYLEELNIEFEEDDITFLELAEFIEQVIIEYIRFEGKSLIDRPFESALEYFEELLQREAGTNSDKDWTGEKLQWQNESDEDRWQKASEKIEKIISTFLSNRYYNPHISGDQIDSDIDYLAKYLRDEAGIERINEFTEEHLNEFFSVWLVREFVLSDTEQIPHIFRATARFITFLYHHYNINMKKSFLALYDALKTDLQRTIRATNTYISEYNMLESLLLDTRNEQDVKLGYFEIISLLDRQNHQIEVKNLAEYGERYRLTLNSRAFYKLQTGDIIEASLIKRSSAWQILEVQYIYPNSAIDFIHQ